MANTVRLASCLILLVTPILTHGQTITLRAIPPQARVSEIDSRVQVCATIDNSVEGGDANATVLLETRDGTAQSGSDFTLLRTTLILNTVTNAERCVEIPIQADDLLEERTEQFTVVGTASNVTVNGLPVSSPPITPLTVDILDSTVVTLGFASEEYIFMEGMANAEVCVQLLNGEIVRMLPIVIAMIAAIPGSAIGGADYGPIPTRVELDRNTPAEGSCVRIPLIDDDMIEEDEMFVLSLSSLLSETRIGDGSNGTEITIIDNDFVTVGFQDDLYTIMEGDSMTNDTVCVEIMNAELLDSFVILVTVAADSGTADSDSDYLVAMESMLTFTSSMNASACLPLTIVDDSIVEDDEKFTLTIANVSGNVPVMIGEANATVCIVDDDDPTISPTMTTASILPPMTTTVETPTPSMTIGTITPSMTTTIIAETTTPPITTTVVSAAPPMMTTVASTTLPMMTTVASTTPPMMTTVASAAPPITTTVASTTVTPTTTAVIVESTPSPSIAITTTVTTPPPTTSTTTIAPTPMPPANCPMPPSLLDGSFMVPFNARPGTTAVYTCNEGFNLEGAAQLVCQIDGSWSPANPGMCVAVLVMCPLLFRPINGQVMISSREGGSTATYSCYTRAGYRLIGVSERVCLSDGTWSDSAPTCESVLCPLLKAPYNGRVEYPRGRTVVSSAYYYCRDGFYLVGDRRRVCRPGGVWERMATPKCLKEPRPTG